MSAWMPYTVWVYELYIHLKAFYGGSKQDGRGGGRRGGGRGGGRSGAETATGEADGGIRKPNRVAALAAALAGRR